MKSNSRNKISQIQRMRKFSKEGSYVLQDMKLSSIMSRHEQRDDPYTLNHGNNKDCSLESPGQICVQTPLSLRPSKTNSQHSENEDEDRDGRKKRKLGMNKNSSEVRRRLKCPYYLRNPDKHRRGSCRGEGFADMGKLKDHLKRVHQKPRQCQRCWQELATEEDETKHLELDPHCPQRPRPEDDRVSAETLRELNFSRIPYAHRSVEEKWKRLYKDLFGNEQEEDVPSPYEEYGVGPDFEKLLVERLEREFEGEFAGLIEKISRESLQERIVDIIRDCKKAGVGIRTEVCSDTLPQSGVSSEADATPPVAGHESLKN